MRFGSYWLYETTASGFERSKMHDKVRISVYVPPELHRQIKYASVDNGKTLQEVVESALWAAVNPQAVKRTRMKPKEIQMWQAQLRRILESSDDLAIDNCTSCIKATVNWLEVEKRDFGDNVAPTPSPKAQGNKKRQTVTESTKPAAMGV
jgi:hypothetical protein